jgi:dipeptidyl aminopeptidase/acylaminoacyl peptidase
VAQGPALTAVGLQPRRAVRVGETLAHSSSAVRDAFGKGHSRRTESVPDQVGRVARRQASGVLFLRRAAEQFDHLYVLPVNGGQPYKLTFGDHDDFHPRWSPDGQWIAYISNRDRLAELYLLETVGGGQKKVALKTLHWKQPMGLLRVSVRDEAGHAMEARMSGKASDGKLYSPRDTFVIN